MKYLILACMIYSMLSIATSHERGGLGAVVAQTTLSHPQSLQ